MKIGITRTYTVELTDEEASKITAALKNALAALGKLQGSDYDFLVDSHVIDHLLWFKTELGGRPR